MKIELTPENAAAHAKKAALAGQTPDQFLNGYITDNMVALFENPRSGEIESHLGSLEYRTRADAERVVAWMGKRNPHLHFQCDAITSAFSPSHLTSPPSPAASW
jgi:hypothetical protein